MPIRKEPVVFLIDVDNTLLDHDAVIADYREHLGREFGMRRQKKYWTIFKRRRRELGYADYLGALERYRDEDPCDPHMLRMSFYLLDYRFDRRLYPGAVKTLRRLRRKGTTVIVSDGDVIFQPRKIERSGLYAAVGGRVLIYIHKERELRDIERRYPACHYVMIDDKIRILSRAKRHWGERVTTVFVRQGHYAREARPLSARPPADVVIRRIAELPDAL